MSRLMRTPTATSYAMLGLLAIRPWSSYELAKLMGRSIHRVLPRAESNVYAEAKRLVADGLATAQPTMVGRRRRTVYEITTVGRVALDQWLTEPARPTTLESEALVKVLFATSLPTERLLEHVQAFEAEVERARGPWFDIATEYLEDRGPFPDRIHVNALFWVFQARYAEVQIEWARWAAAWIATWPSPAGPGAESVKAVLAAELASASGADPGPLQSPATTRRSATSRRPSAPRRARGRS
jgi:PadR family transcriptional regulator, regulatory protein AphA